MCYLNQSYEISVILLCMPEPITTHKFQGYAKNITGNVDSYI